MSAGATIIPKVVICATSELVASFVTSLLIESGQAKKDEICGIVKDSWYGYAPTLRALYMRWEEQGAGDSDIRVIAAFDSLDPEQAFGELRHMLNYRPGIEAVVFTPGFDYIFDEDKELMKRYILDPEHRVPTENCKRGQIRFINSKNDNTDGDE